MADGNTTKSYPWYDPKYKERFRWSDKKQDYVNHAGDRVTKSAKARLVELPTTTGAAPAQRSGPATASYGHGRGSDPPPGTLKSDTTGPAASELASVAGKGKQPARSGTQQSPKASASAFAQPKEPVPNIPQDTSRKLPSQGATLQQTNRALSPGATPSYLQHPGGGGGEGKSITPGIKSSAGNIGGQLALRPATGATATASGRQPTGTVSWSSEAPTKGTYHVSRATERGVLGASSGSGRGGGSGGGGGRGGGSAGGGSVPPKVHRSHKGSDESSLDSVRNPRFAPGDVVEKRRRQPQPRLSDTGAPPIPTSELPMDRFIVLKQCEREEERDQFVALPISTYNNQGLAAHDVVKRHHAIVYSGKEVPNLTDAEKPIRLSSGSLEDGPQAMPIRVKLDDRGAGMDPMSRLNFYNFARHYYRDAGIRKTGHVATESWDAVRFQFQHVHQSVHHAIPLSRPPAPAQGAMTAVPRSTGAIQGATTMPPRSTGTAQTSPTITSRAPATSQGAISVSAVRSWYREVQQRCEHAGHTRPNDLDRTQEEYLAGSLDARQRLLDTLTRSAATTTSTRDLQ